MSETLFIAVLTSMIIIAFNLFALESNDLFSLQTFVGLILMVCLLPSIFVYCYLAESTTANLHEIGDIFYESPWYRLRVNQQPIVVCAIQRAGRVFRFRSLNLIECSLATFLSVRYF